LAGEKADEIILKLATVGITTRSVADTALVADLLASASYTETLQKEVASQRLGVVTNFAASKHLRDAFDQAVTVFQKLGYDMVETTAPFSENPDMQHIDDNRKTANEEIFQDATVLILPTTASEVLTAKAAGDPQALSPQNTFFANYYALPAITIPCGFDEKGLPIGLQVVGKQDDDSTILQVAQAYQNSTEWHARHPR
jgi:aspartyl-tRNA(Asn)/glutamyl-tRNA(Gln) amidotransferase subunit A